jgi:hypothetical protein
MRGQGLAGIKVETSTYLIERGRGCEGVKAVLEQERLLAIIRGSV